MRKRIQFHAHIEVKSRSEGQSAASSVAYICALRVRDVWLRKWHNFRKRHGVLKFACFNFAGTVTELAELLDRGETRGNSCICRTLDVALPRGLTREQRWQLVSAIAHVIGIFWNVPVAGALHLPSKDGDPNNDHGHFVFATREIQGGVLTRKTRELDNRKTGSIEIKRLRAEISRLIIELLVSLGRKTEAEIWDHRSYDELGIPRVPGRHRGPRATKKLRRTQKLEKHALREEIDMLIEHEEAMSIERMIVAIEFENAEPAIAKPLSSSLDSTLPG